MRILIVDDDRTLSELLREHCALRGDDVAVVDEASRLLPTFESVAPDCVFLDVRLGDANGLDLLAQLKAVSRDTPVAVMTGFEPLASASHAAARGAEFFLRKPFGVADVDGVLEKVDRLRQGRPAREASRDPAPLSSTVAFLGQSPAMTEVCRRIGLAARSGVTTLVEGESGVGKELAAQAIHALGGPARPLATVDCSTVVETLFESELFGHERGAFTGAYATGKGKVEAAQGGVLFLDEVGELSLRMQAKLLRLLQTHTFERVGGTVPIRVDFQLVAATNRDLDAMAREGKFRADLLYRLNVHRVRIPPLRERREDIPALARHFLRQTSERLRMPPAELGSQAMEVFVAHAWPGNVRELENVITRLVLESQGRAVDPRAASAALAAPAALPLRTLAQVEREAVLAALESTGWNYGRTCQALGISRPTLRRKVALYGLRPESRIQNLESRGSRPRSWISDTVP